MGDRLPRLPGQSGCSRVAGIEQSQTSPSSDGGPRPGRARGFRRVVAHRGRTVGGDCQVAIIQGNTAMDAVPAFDYLAGTFATYQNMSREAARERPDLIVWPETTMPVNITPESWGLLISRLAAQTGANYAMADTMPLSTPASSERTTAPIFTTAPDEQYATNEETTT